MSRRSTLSRLQRTPLTTFIARVLVLTLLSWSLPFDAVLARDVARTPAGNPVAGTSGVPGGTLYVNASPSAACGGKSPCFTTIQGAIDAVGPGQRIEIQAGTYFEQLDVERKNATAVATEAQRIVIEADPASAPGSVVLRGRNARCEGGYAIEIARSKFVTVRGLTIVGAGVRGIGLRGGSLENRGIHLERNRIGRGGPQECNGGIDVGRGNPQTVIANNLIYGNGRNGIRFRDGRGGSYYVIGNTIARNAWSGVQIAHASAVELVDNLIVANGTAPGGSQARVGVRRLRTNPSPPSQVRLLGNLVCGNAGGELGGPLLDAADGFNSTPLGNEGPGVVARATCGDLAALFRDAAGADDIADTVDDDFHLAPGSVAIDAGVDPRLLGYPASNAVLEADFDGAAARPRDGNGDRDARFDAGAHESAGVVQPTVTPSASSTPTASPSPTPSTPPTMTPTPSATPTPRPSPTPSASPTASPSPTIAPNRFPTIVSTPLTRIVVSVPAVEPPQPSFEFLERVPSDVGSARGDVFTTLPTTDPALFGFTGSDVRKVDFDSTPGGAPLASGTQLTNEYASVGVLMSSIPISNGVYGGAASPPNATFIGPIGGQQSFTFTVPVVAVGIINTSPDQDRIAFYSPSGELMFSIRDQDAFPGPNYNVDRFVGARVTDSNLIGSIVFQNEAGNDEFDELIFEVSTAQLPKADYAYDCDATDPDLDPLTYLMIDGPTGMQVDPPTGRVTWTPTSLDVGPHTVKLRVEDGRGGFDEQQYQLEVVVQPEVPNVVGATQAEAEGVLQAAGFVVGAVMSRHDPQPVGIVLGQTPLGGSRAPSGAAVDVVVSLGPEPLPTPVPTASPILTPTPIVTASPIPTPSPTPDPNATPSPTPTAAPLLDSIVVSPSSKVVLAGETQAFTATAVFEDGTSADLTTQVVWTSSVPAVASIAASGVASALAAGETTITATFGAASANATLSVAPQVPGDTTPPIAAITAPTDGSTIVSLADVIGSASDANLLRWDLEVAPAGDASFTLLATGTSAVSSAKLGELDPTLLLNELYTLRLTVYDRGGNSTAASVAVQLARDQKVGLFSLSFKDLEVSLPGLPITVERTYDSRDKASSDFGVGWRLDLRSLRVRKNRVQGEGWTVTAGGFGPTYQMAPLGPHRVSVTLPDGRVEEFELRTSPSSSFLVPFFDLGTAYVPLAGTLGSLAAVDPSSGQPRSDVSVFDGQPGDVTLLDAFTFDPFDPQAFRYTTVDGTEIFVHVTDGVKSVRDRNGNTLTFTASGITHSSGAMVAFTRDAQQRITRITDLAGAAYDYAYDAHGDLVRYTDAVGNVTRFKYDRRHGLLEIIDPLGNRGIRNEYDPDGRLIATVDAKGKRTEYQHLQGTMQQVETNRLGHTTVREYDAAGNVVRLTDANGKVSTYTYDARGNQLTETDPLGRTASRTYDAHNNVLTDTDVEGRTTTRTYDGRDKLLTVKNAAGETRSFTYDPAGNQLTETDPEGGVTTQTYDARGNRLTTTDATGATTTWTYDALGRRTTETDALGRTTTSTFDANGRELTATRTRTLPGGGTESLVEELAYDASGRLIGKTDASGGAAVLKHGARTDGKVSGIVDQRGLPVDFDYDEIGNLTGIRYADGSIESFDYDAEGRLVGQGDRDGEGTAFAFDALGRQTRATHPDGSFIEVTWDDASRLTSRKDERGNVTTYAYAPGQQIVTDALGHATTIAFDAAGRRSSVLDALGRTTSFTYDGNGNLLTTTFPDGSTTSSTWDGEGRRTSDTDQAGRTTRYAYDPLGRLTKVTDANGGETTYGYDEVGNLIAQTDAVGRTSRFEHDELGRQTKRVKPLGGAELSAYDGQSNRTSRTDFAGDSTTYAYDGSGRMISETLPGGAVVLYEYTPGGLRTRAGADAFDYDARGRMVKETKADGEEIAYGWDAAGNRTSVTSSFGAQSFTYDTLNRLASLTDTTGTTTYGYDAVGNLTSVAHPNATTTTYGYDALNRLTLVENSGPAGLISSYAYTLDVTGKRQHVVESGPATTGRIVGYDYDVLGRLIGEIIDEPGTASDCTVDYTYDAVGNRLTKVETQGTKVTTTTYVYDDDDALLSESTLVEIASIAPPVGVRMVLAGFGLSPFLALLLALGLTLAEQRRPGRRARRRRIWTTTLIVLLAVSLGLAPSFAQSGLLASLAPTDAHAQAAPSVITYAYDANGNLTSRSDGSVVDTYDFDARGRMVASSVASGATPASIVFGYDADGNRISRTVGSETTSFLIDRSGVLPQVLAETTGAETTVYARGLELEHMVRTTGGAHFFLADGAGSTRQLASASGVITDAYTYDAFGNLTAESGSTPNEFLFRGEQLDPNVGFYNLRARWYAQATGRFVSPDPFEGSAYDPGSLHRYLYAHANPVSNEDPSGLFTLVQVAVGIGITAGLAAGITAYLRGASVVQAISIGVATGVAVGLLVYIVAVVGPHLLRVLVQSGRAAFQAASRAAQRALEKALEAYVRRFPNEGSSQIVNLLRQALSRITDAAQRAAGSGGGRAVSREFVRDAVGPLVREIGTKLTAALERVIASSGGRVAKAFFCATLRAYASPSRLGTLRLTGAYSNPTSAAVDLFVPLVHQASAAVCKP